MKKMPMNKDEFINSAMKLPRTTQEVQKLTDLYVNSEARLQEFNAAVAAGKKVYAIYNILTKTGYLYFGVTTNPNQRHVLSGYTSYFKKMLLAAGVKNLKKDCFITIADIKSTAIEGLKKEEEYILSFHSADRISGGNIHTASYKQFIVKPVPKKILSNVTRKPNHSSFVAVVKLPGQKSERLQFRSIGDAVTYTGLPVAEVKAEVAKGEVIRKITYKKNNNKKK